MLGQAIGELLPSAVGVALSPIPIVAVILMLGTPKAKVNGPAFAVGWVLGLTAVSVLVLVVTGGADDTSSGTSDTVDVVVILFGLMLLALAWKQWRSRPEPGTEAQMPKWMNAVDHFTPVRSLAIGVTLSAINPKNLALTLAAATSIAQAGLSAVGDAEAIAVFVILGSLTVAGPVIAYLILGERIAPALDRAKSFMAQNNAVIMAVVCLLLGAKLVGSGIGGLSD